ncbi:Putative flagellar protein [Salinisphaera shabanensis E1L3A]|uniref:Flagellar biosynthetic protein FlhB n=1 Tax=Salinisphaera shabanensis E1L3A TaxID=1033802 RepID=F7Q861_9GAMM|nr:EscU/YscU/HrcU family type III secretion system export apparatus switch protein [Salinisphaera shabanensis]ERJ19051.1 Putative flagellar protein [Salinisphaera shabanensis E1L3A]
MSAVDRSRPGDDRAGVVALRYAEQDDAPRVVAKGYGDIAQAIMDRAEKHGLHVHRSPELVRLLMRVDLDERIPPELYTAVAELLAWVYRLETAADAQSLD